MRGDARYQQRILLNPQLGVIDSLPTTNTSQPISAKRRTPFGAIDNLPTANIILSRLLGAQGLQVRLDIYDGRGPTCIVWLEELIVVNVMNEESGCSKLRSDRRTTHHSAM